MIDFLAEFVAGMVGAAFSVYGGILWQRWERRNISDPILRELREHREATEGPGEDAGPSSH